LEWEGLQYKHGKGTVTQELYGDVQDTMWRHYALVSSDSDVILTRFYFQQIMGIRMAPETSLNIQQSVSVMQNSFRYMTLP
jgi:hypothetical protein